MSEKNDKKPTIDRSYAAVMADVRELNEFARQYNKDPNYRGIGAELGGPGSDALIVAVGGLKAAAGEAQEPVK